jgi:hypothetical protein
MMVVANIPFVSLRSIRGQGREEEDGCAFEDSASELYGIYLGIRSIYLIWALEPSIMFQFGFGGFYFGSCLWKWYLWQQQSARRSLVAVC